MKKPPTNGKAPRTPRHPMQPLLLDNLGHVRFKGNAIVRRLLNESQAKGFGLNEIANIGFVQEEWTQFAQLIGYSLCGFHELSYVSDRAALRATAAARRAGLVKKTAAGGCRDIGCEIHCGVVSFEGRARTDAGRIVTETKGTSEGRS